MADRVDPKIWTRPDLQPVLAKHDIAEIYRALKQAGLSQRQIDALAGHSQSEVSEILKGRQVREYHVLVRIITGLSIPPERMGLSFWGPDGRWYGSNDAYDDTATPSGDVEEVTDDMLRRDVLAKGSAALVGVPVLGALLASSTGSGDLALPSRLGMADVSEIANTTQQLRNAARSMGGQARAVSAAAATYGRLLDVPASEPVKTKLFSQLAELHELAGWCCFDSGIEWHARWHYSQAIDLAQQAGSSYQIASSMRYAGLVDRWRDRPNDALKAFDLAHAILNSHGKGDPDLTAWLHSVSALALADMGHPSAGGRLTMAQEGWQLSSPLERSDQNYQSALVYMGMGKIETAEQFASTVNSAGRHRPVGVFAIVLRATAYVQAGEPRGLLMAKSAIDAVAPLHSVRAKERLVPLAVALEARPGSDAKDLARRARQIAA